MFISAEIRWFWRGPLPATFKDWFLSAAAHKFAAGGGGPGRPDVYLSDSGQTELGIKKRGNKPGAEVKGLVTVVADAVPDGPFKAAAEIWTKWTSKAMQLAPAPTVSTNKVRWMRKFDTTGPTPREIELGPDEEPIREARPATGCNVELTEVQTDGTTVWTFGFEAFGALGSVAAQLRAVAALLAARNPPAMGDVVLASYPAWLSTIAPRLPEKTNAALVGLSDAQRQHLSEKLSALFPLQEILRNGVTVETLAVMVAEHDLTSLLRHYVSLHESTYDPDNEGVANQIVDYKWDTKYVDLQKDMQLMVAAR